MKSTLARPPALHDAVEYVGSLGFFVVPLHSIRDSGGCTCPARDECSNPGKHPHGRLARNGTHDATSRPERINEWFDRRPWLNVGIATGPSQLVVLDVDPRNGGLDSLRHLVKVHGPLPRTRVCLTGGGGQHWYYRVWDRQPPEGSAAFGPGLDVKARTGLVVAPPSLHATGSRYYWVDSNSRIAPCPEFLAHWDQR